jgi:CheY-like chemotaxis protein
VAVPELRKPVFAGQVLVCEDNTLNQEVIGEQLRRVGLEMTLAENGEKGVAAIRERLEKKQPPFDIILMDIHMPVMDGLEATQRIRELGNQAPVIAMTADVSSHNMEIYDSYGMAGYLNKPFVVQELWACLLRFLTPVERVSGEESSPDNPAGLPFLEASFFTAGVINAAVGLQMSGGDRKLYQRLLVEFAQSQQNVWAELTAAADAGNITEAHRLAHTLKNIAALIGAERLPKTAHAIELGLAQGKAAYSASQLAELETDLREVLAELTPFATAREPLKAAAKDAELDRDKARELIKVLEPLLQAANPASLSLLAAVRETLAPWGEKCEQLTRQIDDYEFILAAATLAAIKHELGAQ